MATTDAQLPGGVSFEDRIRGAAGLRPAAYAEIAGHPGATLQAAIVVAVAAGADAIGNVAEEGGRGLVNGAVGGLFAWAVFAGIVLLVGTRLLGAGPARGLFERLLRALGFAQVPLVLTVFGVIPILGGFIALVAFAWFSTAAVVAIRQALRVTLVQALVTGLIALLAYGLARLVVWILLGIGSWFGLG